MNKMLTQTKFFYSSNKLIKVNWKIVMIIITRQTMVKIIMMIGWSESERKTKKQMVFEKFWLFTLHRLFWSKSSNNEILCWQRYFRFSFCFSFCFFNSTTNTLTILHLREYYQLRFLLVGWLLLLTSNDDKPKKPEISGN